MKRITLIAVMALALALPSCKSYTTYTEVLDNNGKITSRSVTFEKDKMADKGVAFGGSVSAMQLETDINMSSGNPTPLPKVKVGFFTFFWIDAPLQSGGVYFNQEKSLWSGNVASTTYVKFGSTSTNNRITISSEPEPFIDLDGILTVANPMMPNRVNIKFNKPESLNVKNTFPVNGPDAALDSSVKVDTGISTDTAGAH